MEFVRSRIAQLKEIISKCDTKTGKIYYRGRLDEMVMMLRKMEGANAK